MPVTTNKDGLSENRNLGGLHNTLSLKTAMRTGLVLLLFVALAWFGVSKREEARKFNFVIPPHTSQQIADGQAAVNLPDEIVLTVGIQDTIVIENQDDVIHSFGPFVVGPHSTLTKRFDVPIIYEGACTFHPEQQMRLVVNPAPWDFFN